MAKNYVSIILKMEYHSEEENRTGEQKAQTSPVSSNRNLTKKDFQTAADKQKYQNPCLKSAPSVTNIPLRQVAAAKGLDLAWAEYILFPIPTRHRLPLRLSHSARQHRHRPRSAR
jgi:hypothetical protein